MPNLTAAQFRARAISLVGLPYVLGAEWSPSCVLPCLPAALDCSELVEGLYRENGTPIGDLAAAQYDKTAPVTGQPQVGDLVFLRNNSLRWNGIGHVAVITAHLSTGDWEIIEARGRTAGVVRTTLSYWETRTGYTGVRRYPGFALAAGEPIITVGRPAPLVEDGDIGPLSVRALQWSLTLPQTGRLTRTTVAALQVGLGVPPTGDLDAATVRRLQWWVDETIDGNMGPRTAAGLQRWMNAVIAADTYRYHQTDGDVLFRAGTANLHDPRFGGSTDYAGRADRLRARLACSLIVLTESNRAMRRAIREAHGPRWWVIPHRLGSVALLVDLAKWRPVAPGAIWPRQVAFSDYHGAMAVALMSEQNRQALDVVAVHVRPAAIATTRQKENDVAKAAQLTAGVPAVSAGDWSLDPDTRLPDWLRASPDVDTMPGKAGTQRVDAVLARRLDVRGPGALVNPGPLSDHLWVRGSLTLPAQPNQT